MTEMRSSGGDALDPEIHIAFADGTGWGHRGDVGGVRALSSVYQRVDRVADRCGARIADDPSAPAYINDDSCWRPVRHDGPHALATSYGLAYAEWGLPAPASVEEAPVLVTHTSWGALIPEGAERYADGWYLPGGQVAVPNGWHSEYMSTCQVSGGPVAGGSYICWREPGHEGAHSIGVGGDITAGEWGMTQQATTTATPIYTSTGGDALDPESHVVLPDGSGWGQHPNLARPGGYQPLALATTLGPRADFPCRAEPPRAMAGNSCRRRGGHDGPHSSVSLDGDSWGEWGFEPGHFALPPVADETPEQDAPAVQPEVGATLPRMHSSAGDELDPAVHYILPDGTGWGQLGTGRGESPRALRSQYPMPSSVLSTCYVSPPWFSDANLDPCTREQGHTGPHVSFSGSGGGRAWAEWGLEPEVSASGTGSHRAPNLSAEPVTHTTWGMPLPDAVERTPTSWSSPNRRTARIVVDLDHRPAVGACSAQDPSGQGWVCTRREGHTGAHFAGLDSNSRCVAEWGIREGHPTAHGAFAQDGNAVAGWTEIGTIDGASVYAAPVGTELPTGADIPVDPQLAGEQMVSAEAIRREARRLAEANGWCPEHHEPLRRLGLEPLGYEYDGEVVIRIPVKHVRTAYFNVTTRNVETDFADAVRFLTGRGRVLSQDSINAALRESFGERNYSVTGRPSVSIEGLHRLD